MERNEVVEITKIALKYPAFAAVKIAIMAQEICGVRFSAGEVKQLIDPTDINKSAEAIVDELERRIRRCS